MFRKESDYTDYGKGSPGYNQEVRLYLGDTRIARAFGPNTNGWMIGEFRDMDAVSEAIRLPDGPIDGSIDVLALLAPCHADRFRHK